MHDSDPNDQLSDGMQTNRACLQCHPAMQADVTAHTHHAADSPGSLCYNCHMPHTSYGLFKATRSHRITSPSVERIAHKSRPNACNLCHQDQSLQWTATHLSTWYDMASPELSPDEQTKSAWMLWLLKGDAGLRVVTAWHARSMAAKQAADSDWQDIPLARLIDDPYTAVQWVTRRSLQSFDGWQDLSQQDFYANDATRHALTNATLQRTRTRMMESPALVRKFALLLQVDAEITTIENELTRILAQRDDRPIASVE